MKKYAFIITFFLSFNLVAQKGVELKLTIGHNDIGNERWLSTGQFSISSLYNFSGIVAIGPSYTTGIGTKYNFFDNNGTTGNNKLGSKMSELAINAQFTFARANKFKFYGKLKVGQIRAENDVDATANMKLDREISGLKDNTIGLGIGLGAMLNLGGGFYLNLIDITFNKVKSNFMDLDKTLTRQYQAGIAYNFGGN